MKRKCTDCKKEKDLNEENFYKKLLSPDGYTPQCKECLLKKGRKNQEKYKAEKRWENVF